MRVLHDGLGSATVAATVAGCRAALLAGPGLVGDALDLDTERVDLITALEELKRAAGGSSWAWPAPWPPSCPTRGSRCARETSRSTPRP